MSEANSVQRGVGLLPQPGAWVAKLGCDGGHPQIALVRATHGDHNTLDLIFYSASGERVGRLSPAMGGPRGFEPFCCADDWVHIEAPRFEEIAEAERWGWRELLKPMKPNTGAEL